MLYSIAANGGKSSRQGESHPKPFTEPCLKVSTHTALVIQIIIYPSSNHWIQVLSYSYDAFKAKLLYL